MTEAVLVEARLDKVREQSPRLVYVGSDGDVYRATQGSGSAKLTCGWFDDDEPERLHYVWPTFSPDGNSVACFGLRPGATTEASLFAVDGDGVRMSEVWSATEALPICESWSYDSRYIALLCQHENRLALEVADVLNPGHAVPIVQAAPLFWSWSPSGSVIAVHAGGSRRQNGDAQLKLVNLEDGFEPVATLVPGDFRTPAWSPDGRRMAYIDASGKHEQLAMYRIDDGATEIVSSVDSHCAFLWSPDGKTLAVAHSVGNAPHVYVGLSLVDVRTGRREVVSDCEFIGFFWSPSSGRIILIELDDDRGMRWGVLDTRGCTLGQGEPFYPTNDFMYFCQFFDQFAVSHPLISPDGRSLVFAGSTSNVDAGQKESESGVYLTPIDGAMQPQRLAAGHFACWEASMSQASRRRHC